MPPHTPNAAPRLAALEMDLAKIQVIAALATSNHNPGSPPFAAAPPKNCAALTRLGMIAQMRIA